MKKLFLIILSFFILMIPVFADDVDLTSTGDLWDNWTTDGDGRETVPVSDEDFDQAIEQVKDKQNRNWLGMKKKNKNIPKGEEFRQSNDTETINEHSNKASLPVLSIPVELAAGEEFLPVGHYQIKGEKEGGNVYINFYQSHYLMAKYPAIETNDDFDKETISFGDWFAEGNNKIKVIFGSMEFNAYTLIDIYRSNSQE